MAESVAPVEDTLMRKKDAAAYCRQRFPHITSDTIDHHVYKKGTLARPTVRDHKAYWPKSVLDAWLEQNFDDESGLHHGK